jgi:hypothetical protein
MRRVESRREQLLSDKDVAGSGCPPLLASMVAPNGAVGDHTTSPIVVMEREVATVELLFGAPLVVSSPTSAVPHAAAYRSSRRGWYDINILPKRPAGSNGNGTEGQRRSQRITVGDYSWLRAELKPKELTALEGYSSDDGALPAQGTPAWRLRVAMLVSQWIRNAWLVREHENFVNTVGIHERLAFEYHSFLCGIGETAAPWNTESIRNSPTSWLQLHPRVVICFDPTSVQSSSVFGGASHVCCRIPLLQDPELSTRMRSRLSLWVDLRQKLQTPHPTTPRETLDGRVPLILEVTLHLELVLVNMVSYRVDRERIRGSFECSGDVSVDQRMRWEAHRDALQLSCPYFLAEDLPHARSPHASPRSSPSPMTRAGSGGVPSFCTLHRLQNATIMEYLPVVEDHLMEQCVETPVHYLSLLWALTEYFGLPLEFSTDVWNVRGGELQRSAVFTAYKAEANISVLIEVRYVDGKSPPWVEVRCPTHTMPDSKRPLAASVRLQDASAFQLSTTPGRSKLFNVQIMAQSISDGVSLRFEQILRIIHIANQEAQRRLCDDEAGQRAVLSGAETDAFRVLELQCIRELAQLQLLMTRQTSVSKVSNHVDPVMDLLTISPLSEQQGREAVMERDFMGAGQFVHTREAMRREDTAFRAVARSARTTSPETEESQPVAQPPCANHQTTNTDRSVERDSTMEESVTADEGSATVVDESVPESPVAACSSGNEAADSIEAVAPEHAVEQVHMPFTRSAHEEHIADDNRVGSPVKDTARLSGASSASSDTQEDAEVCKGDDELRRHVTD